MTFTNGNSTKFFYSAEGEKLRAVHKTSGSTTQVDYCDNIIYEAGEQKYLLNQEGYYDLEAGGYHYYLKDHLGNNRVVISHSGAVEQTTHYYPYGGTFSSSTTGQPYKYNGKELDTHNGLNWYDYGARHYDPAIARWTAQDPLAEKYYGWNQYNYCLNNPFRYYDPDGKDSRDKAVGYIIGFITNIIPNSGELRDKYTPASFYDYNQSLKNADRLSDIAAVGLITTGSSTIIAGAAVSSASATGTVVTGGAAAVITVPATAAGAAISTTGVAATSTGMLLMANSHKNKDGGYNRGKSLSATKKAVQEAKEKLNISDTENLAKGKGKFGSPMRGDSKRGYRLDPPHPNAEPGSGEEFHLVNYWDYTRGKRNTGGIEGVIPIKH